MNHYTFFGLFAVLIWGISIPISRIVQEQIGPVAYMSILFLGTSLLSFARQKFSFSITKSERSHPALYLRGAFFILHETFIFVSVGIVSLKHLAIVILINYLWPTAIIIFSILIAGVRVYQILPFILGTGIVVSSLFYELLGSGVSSNIFLNKIDNIAYCLTFLGALSWGLYCAISKRYGEKTGEARPIPLFQLILGTLALSATVIPSFHHSWNLNSTGTIVLVGMCLAQTFAYSAWDTGMRLGNIIILSLFADFIPWLSLLGTMLILDVKLESRTIISAICLVVGAVLTRFATRKP